MKALDRKVWLPSGGSLVIDRTEAMTVVDVNTGKFIGSGGNLEQTVTRNNLEAAEEIVRQLRLRDIGGIVVIDFIDMVLESNRELVLRRLTECLGRDRTKHQVAEVTSLGLVQMTRKRVGEGLLEAFSEPCEHCNGRGVLVHADPVDRSGSTGGSGHDSDEDDRPRGRRKRGGRGGAKTTPPEPTADELAAAEEQRKLRLAAMTAIHRAAHPGDESAAQAAAEAELAAIEAADGTIDLDRDLDLDHDLALPGGLGLDDDIDVDSDLGRDLDAGPDLGPAAGGGGREADHEPEAEPEPEAAASPPADRRSAAGAGPPPGRQARRYWPASRIRPRFCLGSRAVP